MLALKDSHGTQQGSLLYGVFALFSQLAYRLGKENENLSISLPKASRYKCEVDTPNMLLELGLFY